MATAIKLEAAPVQWWGAHDVYVLCPFCDNIHHHGFNGDYSRGHSRVAHCNLPRSRRFRDRKYEFKFPVGRPDVAYEIDKSNMRFVAAGARLPQYYVSDDEERAFGERLRDAIDKKPKWTDATEAELVHKDISVKITLVVSELVKGNAAYVGKYLETSSDAEIFLEGVEAWEYHQEQSWEDTDGDGAEVESNTLIIETSGKTALHLAACESSPDMVELLLSRGADANAADLDGCTPLMEAALWGRLENVELLLKHGADKNRTRIEENQEIRAVDLAKQTQKNAERRRSRGGSVYKEDTYASDLDRREIVRLLKDATEEPSLLHLESFAFQHCGSDGLSMSLTSHYGVPNKRKTVARLVRGGGLADISAMSCWSHADSECIQIANRDWTGEVFSLCNLLGFTLEPHSCDQGVPGQFNACHAEKQLIAWFVQKHLFLETEWDISEQENKRALVCSQMSNEELDGDQLERLAQEVEQIDQDIGYKMRLAELYRAAPREPLKRALIVVSTKMCPCCCRFAEHVNGALRLELQIHHRCMDSSCDKCGN